MLIGLTYDLRSDYLASGFSLEETAEFDRDDTITAIENSLEALGYETDRIGHARALVKRLEAGDRWDIVFNICEGFYGIAREAQVPAILDLYDIPYVFSSPLVLALALHKGIAKRVVRDAGVPTSDFCIYESKSSLENLHFPEPYFVKPIAEGTGKGCSRRSIVRHRAELNEVCHDLTKRFHQPALIESYLPGREFTIGITGNNEDSQIVATMEILLLENAEEGAYSYSNKDNYESRVIYEYRTPIDDPVVAEAEKVALGAWHALGCQDGGRVDLRCDSEGCPKFLEVNPLAGLHPEHSDLCILARMAGISYVELIDRIMSAAISRLQEEGRLACLEQTLKMPRLASCSIKGSFKRNAGSM